MKISIMKPLKFKEAQTELKKPSNMTDEECSSLWVFRDGTQCVSLWTTSFWQRVKFLFHGKIWVGIVSGETQPPIWLDCQKQIFNYEKKRRVTKVVAKVLASLTFLLFFYLMVSLFSFEFNPMKWTYRGCWAGGFFFVLTMIITYYNWNRENGKP